MANKNMTLGVHFASSGIPMFQAQVVSLKKTLSGLDQTLGSVSTGLNSIDSSIKKVGSSSRQSSSYVTQFANSFKYFLTGGLVYKGLNQVTQALGVGAQAVVSYDQALFNLQAITGATEVEIQLLGNTLVDVGNRTKYTTSQLAEGLVLIGQSGFTAAEQMAVIEDVSNLAAGTLSSLANTADLVTTSLRAFGLEAVESGRVVDVMANAVNKSKLTIEKLSTAFNFVGSSSKQAGLEIEETATTLGLLANAGAKASTSATGLRQVIARLSAPNKKLKEEFDSVGISLDSVNPKTNSWKDVLENLADILYDAETNSVNMEKAFRLFGLRGAQTASILVKSVAGIDDQYSELYEKINKVGTAGEMAEIQLLGLGAMLDKLGGVAQNTIIALSDSTGLGYAFKTFISVLTSTLNVIQDVINNGMVSLILKMTLAATAVGGLIAVLAKLRAAIIGTASIQLLISAFVSLEAATAAAGVAMLKLRAIVSIVNPYVAIGAAIAAAGVAVYNFAQSSKRATEELKAQIVKISGSISDMETWASIIKSASNNTDEYTKTLIRFKEENPEFTKYLEDQKIKFDDISGSVDTLIKKLNQYQTSQILDQLSKENKLLGDINTQYNKYKKLKEAAPEENAFAEKYNNLLQDQNESIEDIAKTYTKLAEIQGISSKSIVSFIEKQNYSYDIQKKLIAEVEKIESKRLDKLKREDEERLARLNKQAKIQLDNLSLLTANQRLYYDELDTYDKQDFANKLKNIKTELDGKEETYKKSKEYLSLSIDDKQKSNQKLSELTRDHAQEEIQAYIESQKKKEDEAGKNADKLLKIQQQLNIAVIRDEKQVAVKKAEIDRDRRNAEITEATKAGSKRNSLLLQSETVLKNELQKINIKFRDEDFRKERIHQSLILDVKRKALEEDKALHAEVQTAFSEFRGADYDLEKKNLDRKYLLAVNYYGYSEQLYNEYLVKIKELKKQEADHNKEINQQMIEDNGNLWENFVLGMQKAENASRTWNQTLQSIGTYAINEISDGIADWIVNLGKADMTFQEFASNFLKQIAKMIIQQTILNALQAGIGMIGGGATGTGPTVGGSPIPQFAKGGAFYNGMQMFASGGIVSEPTYFTHAGGAGLMGEAGSEAIMPVKRMSNGDLGVQMEGGAGNTYNVNINVDGSTGGTEDQNRKYAQTIANAVDARIRQIMVKERRSGGINSTSVGGSNFATI